LRDWLTDGVAEPEPMRMPAPVKVDAVQARLEHPRLKMLFDQLGAPPAKRLATLERYPDNDKLIQILEGKVKEEDLAKEKIKGVFAKQLAGVHDEPAPGQEAPQ